MEVMRLIDTAYIVRSISPAEVIERYTGNRPQHNKYLCPFHRDKHPSLSVKTDIWRCWSCGKGGNVINFVQEYFGLGFVDACRKLNDAIFEKDEAELKNDAEKIAACNEKIKRLQQEKPGKVQALKKQKAEEHFCFLFQALSYL